MRHRLRWRQPLGYKADDYVALTARPGMSQQQATYSYVYAMA